MVTRRGIPHALRRALRIGRRVLQWLVLTLLGLVLVVALVLALAPTRGALLGLGVKVADRYLAGRLTVGATAWPAPGHIVLRDLVWLDDRADTLAVVPLLDLTVDLGALRHHDLLVDSLLVVGDLVDVPGLQAAFAKAIPDSTAEHDNTVAPDTTAAAPIPYLRAGAVDGLPSMSLRRLDLGLGRLVLPSGISLTRIRCAGHADLGHDRPVATVDLVAGLQASLNGDVSYFADLSELRMVGHYGPGLAEVELDSLNLTVVAGEVDRRAALEAAGPVTLRLAGGGRIDPVAPDLPFDLTVRGDLAAPLSELLGDVWPEFLPREQHRHLAAGFDIAASGLARGTIEGTVDLDLAGSDGLDRARTRLWARLTADDPRTMSVRLDTLDLAVPGPVLAGLVTLVGLVTVVDPATIGPLELQLAGSGHTDLAVPDPELAVSVHGSVVSPLADLVGAAWPGDLDRGDHGRLSADFAVDASGSPHGTIEGDVNLDLSGSDSFDRGRTRFWARVAPDDLANLDLAALYTANIAVRLDTLDLSLPGLELFGRGALADSTVDLSLRMAAATPLPLLALVGPPYAAASASIDLDLRARGPRRAPLGTLNIQASYEDSLRAGTLDFDLQAAGAPSAPVGRLALAATYRDADLEVAGVSLQAEGDTSAVQARLRAGSLKRGGMVVVDSLAADLSYTAADTLPMGLAATVLRGANRLTLLMAAGSDTVFTARLDSLQLVAAGQTIRLEAPTTVRVDTARGHYELEPLVLVGDPGRLHAAGYWRGQELALKAGLELLFTEDLIVQLVPAEIWSRDGGADLSIVGDFELGGTPGTPIVEGGVAVEVLPHRDRPRLGANVDFGLDDGKDGGLVADLGFTANDTLLLGGRIFWPGRMDLETGAWHATEGRDLEITVPEQRLALALFKSFLPPEITAGGSVLVAADVAWPVGLLQQTGESPDQGRLAGRLEAKNLDLTLPNTSRAQLSMDLRAEGTPLDPKLAGEITVESGFIRIPEMPQSLHAVEGRSVLWEMARADTIQPTGGAGPLPATWGAQTEVEVSAAPLPDMDLRVRMPGNLRLHGYGLDAELEGDFKVTRGVDKKGRPGPALDGEVRIERGTLRFMNHSFDIRRGRVMMTGNVPANPELDLVLDTETNGYRITVTISGRTDDPVVGLTSEPDLNKVDIMAVLVFGRPLNDLDSDQRGSMREEDDAAKQMRENLAGLAMVFGTQGLQNTMSSTFGVDVIEMGTDSSGNTTFAAGKYLNPQLLVKYHQSLEQSGTYFVTLEYALSRAFRLVSVYGQGEEASGIEIKWTRRY